MTLRHADFEDVGRLRREVEEVPLWYHTLELAPGVVTPGWFDLRPIVDRMPWPDVRGKRCLDVGTYDGHLAFELERRGAGEVVALDLADHAEWDWPDELRARAPDALAKLAGATKGAGFELARRALGSEVERVEASVYDLDPHRHGRFDVVVCGSLLLHLKAPVRALEAIRRVCADWFLSAEQVDLSSTLLHPRRPLAEVARSPERLLWWTPNVAAHRRMVWAAGFELADRTRPYAIPLGEGHPRRRRVPWATRLLQHVVARGEGVVHAAVLARPRG